MGEARRKPKYLNVISVKSSDRRKIFGTQSVAREGISRRVRIAGESMLCHNYVANTTDS